MSLSELFGTDGEIGMALVESMHVSLAEWRHLYDL